VRANSGRRSRDVIADAGPFSKRSGRLSPVALGEEQPDDDQPKSKRVRDRPTPAMDANELAAFQNAEADAQPRQQAITVAVLFAWFRRGLDSVRLEVRCGPIRRRSRQAPLPTRCRRKRDARSRMTFTTETTTTTNPSNETPVPIQSRMGDALPIERLSALPQARGSAAMRSLLYVTSAAARTDAHA
jgi:hypothetical protein